jgi:hypothetical protein
LPPSNSFTIVAVACEATQIALNRSRWRRRAVAIAGQGVGMTVARNHRHAVWPTKSRSMTPADTRRKTQAHASFHDATAREAYASWFRPIALPAVAAGTRRPVAALDTREKDTPSRLAGVLRNGFDD